MSISYQTFNITIEPNSYYVLHKHGDFFTCQDASGTFKISINNSTLAHFEAGLTVKPDAQIESVRIENTSAQTLALSVGVGIGDFRDSRVTLSPGQVLKTREQSPDTFKFAAFDVSTAIQINDAQDALLREVVIQVSDDAATPIYITDSADNEAGIKLDAGSSATLHSSAAIFLRAVDVTKSARVTVAKLSWGV